MHSDKSYTNEAFDELHNESEKKDVENDNRKWPLAKNDKEHSPENSELGSKSDFNGEYKDKGTELHEITSDQPSTNRESKQDSHKSTNRYSKWIKWGTITILNLLVVAYFAWATYHFVDMANHNSFEEWPPNEDQSDDFGVCKNPCELSKPQVIGYCPGYCGMEWCNGYGMLVILFVLTYVALFYYHIVKPFFGTKLHRAVILPIVNNVTNLLRRRWAKKIIAFGILALMLAYVVVDAIDSPARLQSLGGIFVLFGLGYAFSAHRNKINYQPVFCGFFFQFLLGVICIRWDVGRQIFRCIGGKVATFLRYTDEGSRFVYGNYLVDTNLFFFSVMSIIFFFSFIISVLYYLEVMQFVVMKLGWILQTLIGTTVIESVICAANIFLGMSESPLLVRPYIKYLTASEIHVIISSGFATVSGSVLAAYISYGAEASHLITSSVMAAPAALAFSKLFYPETEQTKTKADQMVLEKSTDSSIMEAAANGATLAVPIVLGVTAALIAFVSFVAFLNGIIGYLGHLVGYDGITFDFLVSKPLIPLAWVIGIPWEDCELVAGVIATKSMINEFVAYERLGYLKQNNLISLRSSAITTFAICGFANPSSVGIMIATLGTLAPNKRSEIMRVAVRGYFSGSMICFLTASIAGLLMTDDIINEH